MLYSAPLFWIALALSAVVILEIAVAAVLYIKLARRKQRPAQPFYAFLGVAGAAYILPLGVSILCLLAEAGVLLYHILRFAALLKAPVAEGARESISVDEARSALDDEAALQMIEKRHDPSIAAYLRMLAGKKRYKNRAIVNVDTLSQHFDDHEHVNLHAMKAKNLIPAKTDFVKVLGKGTLAKLLHIEAHDFSADAVKMIVLTGGRAIEAAPEA